MKCNFCGSEITGADGVCEICGHEVQIENNQNTKQSEKPQNTSKKKTAKKPIITKRGKKIKVFGINLSFILMCAAALAVIILVPTLIITSLIGAKPLKFEVMHTFYSKTTGVTSIVESGKIYEKTVEGEIVKKLSSSDGSVSAMLSEHGDLYKVSADDITLISSGVKNCVISQDGSKIAYLVKQAEESSTEESTTEKSKKKQEPSQEETTEYIPAGPEEYTKAELSLFVYNCVDGESKHIENAVAETSISLSPTGKAVCYTKSDKDGENFQGYVCNNGVFSAVGRNAVPIAVSDDGSFLYYVKYEIYEDNQVLKLFVKNGEKEEKLGEYSDGNGLSMYLNADFSETVFSVTGETGNFFLWTSLKEKQKLSSGFTAVYPFGKNEISNGKTVIAPTESFSGFVFYDNEKTAKYIDKKYVCNDLVVKADFFRVNADMSKLYFVDRNEYLFVTDLKKIETSDIASHVLNFDISVDGEMLYYVNSDKELHCYKGSSDKVISENADPGTRGLAVTEGGYLYYLKDYAYGSGTLCYLKNGGSEHVVKGTENVHDIIIDKGDNIYYRSDYGTISGTYDLYYGKAGKYELLFQNMG